MKGSTFLLFLIMSLFVCSKMNSQTEDTKYIQFGGIVIDEDSKPFSFVNIRNLNRNISLVTNQQGFFTSVAAIGDRIEFSYLGYKKQIITIPSTIEEGRYLITVQLSSDTILLKGPTVRGYPSLDELRDTKVTDMTDNINENTGFHKLDHAPEYKKPSPIFNPISSISNAVQKNKMKNRKGGLDPYHQQLLIRDFFQPGDSAVPDSILQQYNPY